MHDKPHTFPTAVDKTTVHSLVLDGVAICVRSFEFTTVIYNDMSITTLKQYMACRSM